MLYLVPTPIGNLSDMTYRAVDVLKNAALIACEDTRTSRTLLKHYEISTPVTSYHEFNKIDKAETLLVRLRAGEDVALITDAGTPGISDPGEELVRFCYDEGIGVCALPGACAAITAAVSSGQSTRRLSFEGFLPKDKKERHRVLSEMGDETRTMVVYEAPHHLVATLKELASALGGDRGITLCRELTKLHEEKERMTLLEALAEYGGRDISSAVTEDADADKQDLAENTGDNAGCEPDGISHRTPRGEYVLVIAGKDRAAVQAEQAAKWDEVSISEHLQMYMEQGSDRKSAMKQVAADRGISKREVYAALLERGTAP